MGLAAVPFGTAQAENYEIVVSRFLEPDGVAVSVGTCEEEYWEQRLHACFECRSCKGLFDGYSGCENSAKYSVIRGFHNEKGGKVSVTDTKFSEGKNITRKDVEEQWHKEEGLLRDRLVRNGKDRGCGKNSFPVDNAGISVALDCKMYDLPEGVKVMHFAVLAERLINFFLVKDEQRSFGGPEYMLVVVVPNSCESMTVKSCGIPTVVCGGEVKDFVSSNEVLAPSVRARLLSVFGQKELSVNRCAAVCKSERDKSEVLLKDCSFAQRAEAIIQVRYDFSDEGGFVGSVFRRLSLYGRFVFDPVMTRTASCGNDPVFLLRNVQVGAKVETVLKKSGSRNFFTEHQNVMPFIILEIGRTTSKMNC